MILHCVSILTTCDVIIKLLIYDNLDLKILQNTAVKESRVLIVKLLGLFIKW